VRVWLSRHRCQKGGERYNVFGRKRRYLNFWRVAKNPVILSYLID
jgi:hypothetical protein